MEGLMSGWVDVRMGGWVDKCMSGRQADTRLFNLHDH